MKIFLFLIQFPGLDSILFQMKKLGYLQIKLPVLLIISIFIFTSNALAGDDDNTYIESYNSKFSLRPSVNINRLSLSIYGGETKLIDYLPNNSNNYGIDVSYDNFGFGLNNKIPGSEKNEDTRGKTDSDDYQVYYYSRKFGVDLFYQKYKGFYSKLGENSLIEGEVRSDMKMLNTGMNAYYIFSDNFSLKAAFKQSENQKKTAVTFLLGASTSYFTIDSDRSLMPLDYDSAPGKHAGYRGGKYLNFAVMPGIGIIYLPESYMYMTFFALMGGGVSYAKSRTGEGEDAKTTDIYKVNAKYSIGFNTVSFYIGSSIILDFTVTSQFTGSTVKVGSGLMFLEFYTGVRF